MGCGGGWETRVSILMNFLGFSKVFSLIAIGYLLVKGILPRTNECRSLVADSPWPWGIWEGG